MPGLNLGYGGFALLEPHEQSDLLGWYAARSESTPVYVVPNE
jgi:hypothetical protein